jgi:hypothetical protein
VAGRLVLGLVDFVDAVDERELAQAACTVSSASAGEFTLATCQADTLGCRQTYALSSAAVLRARGRRRPQPHRAVGRSVRLSLYLRHARLPWPAGTQLAGS